MEDDLALQAANYTSTVGHHANQKWH